MHRSFAIVALAASGLFASSTTASGDTLTVCASGCQYTSINAAIDASSNGDVIQLAAETYYEGSVVDTDGKAITLRGATDKNGNAASILDGGESHRVLQCINEEGADTTFENLVIQNGSASGEYPDQTGGGMYNVNSSPTLTNCSFENNSAEGNGGGMYNENNSPTLTNCSFLENNSVDGGGGGMVNWESSPTLTNCSFENNSSRGGGGMGNVRIFDATLTNCSFENNSSTIDGGGILNVQIPTGGLTLSDCTFTDNSAKYGGGMLNESSHVSVANCTFTDNSASYGGGIFDDYGSGTLSNCTFENNSAEIRGGGLYGEVSEMNLIDCLMAGNSAGVAGGGMFHWALPDRETYSTGTGLSLCGNSPENISIHEDCDCGYVGTYTCQSALADCSDCDDSDGDGVPDFMDACPGGDDSVDSDDDGTPDGCDGCPNDPNKTDPGSCGCGVVDTNVNGDLDCDGDYDEDDVRAAMADFGITEGTPGDMDGDDDVDAADFVAVRDQVGVEALGCLVADINGDGQVDGADFAYVLGYWGLCSAP